MREIYFFVVTAFVLNFIFHRPTYAAPPDLRYMGTATCASSNCHGAATPRNSSNVLQNEYVTWSKKDAHSKAWRVLTTEDSKKIGYNLGIKDPSKDPLCLKCHSTYVKPELQDKKFSIEDGVTCESCHGPAEKWLSSHTSASHSSNVSRGMNDLVPLEKRAQFCLDCHYGNDDKFVNHTLIGAGHPRLSFELDTYSMIQPRHWDYDKDYIERKGSYDPVKAWLIGQTEVSLSTLKLLSSEKRSKNGIWPELSMFNCYACHHSLSQKQWREREYKNGPGELRLNLSSILMVRDALAVTNPALAEMINQKLEVLHNEFKEGQASTTLLALNNLFNKDVYNSFREINISPEISSQLLSKAMNRAAVPHLQYEEAEQILMGISAILSTDKNLYAKYSRKVDNMYASLKTPEEYISESFTQAANQ